MHPWHDLPPGDPEGCFGAVIEVPLGGTVKYELDEALGVLRLDRVLYSAVHYPANYGYIPQSLGSDGDALDVLVLMDQPVVPLTLLRARAIGVLPMIDEAGMDEKIIAVCCDDPGFAHYQALEDLPPHQRLLIERFFLDYKILEEKEVETGSYRGREEAIRIIRESLARYEREVARR